MICRSVACILMWVSGEWKIMEVVIKEISVLRTSGEAKSGDAGVEWR